MAGRHYNIREARAHQKSDATSCLVTPRYNSTLPELQHLMARPTSPLPFRLRTDLIFSSLAIALQTPRLPPLHLAWQGVRRIRPSRKKKSSSVYALLGGDAHLQPHLCRFRMRTAANSIPMSEGRRAIGKSYARRLCTTRDVQTRGTYFL